MSKPMSKSLLSWLRSCKQNPFSRIGLLPRDKVVAILQLWKRYVFWLILFKDFSVSAISISILAIAALFLEPTIGKISISTIASSSKIRHSLIKPGYDQSTKTIMIIILLSYLVSAYIFSGLACWLLFLRNFNQYSNFSKWQRLFATLASSVIIIFWPIWMVLNTSDLTSSTTAVTSLTQTDSNSRFLLQTQQD